MCFAASPKRRNISCSFIFLHMLYLSPILFTRRSDLCCFFLALHCFGDSSAPFTWGLPASLRRDTWRLIIVWEMFKNQVVLITEPKKCQRSERNKSCLCHPDILFVMRLRDLKKKPYFLHKACKTKIMHIGNTTNLGHHLTRFHPVS